MVNMENIAFLFPGVGSQHHAMGKEFYENYEIFRNTIEDASNILSQDFRSLFYLKEENENLNKLDNAQLALVIISIATFRVLQQELNIQSKYYLGHSLGEYSALCCAGYISFKDTLQLVKERGKLINEICTQQKGTMMWVINLDTNIVEKICKEYNSQGYEVYVSAYDSATQCSISGSNSNILTVARRLEEAGAIIYPIKMQGPFHSPLMEEAAEKMRTILMKYEFKLSSNIVLANRNSLPYTDSKSIVDNLSMQIKSPIMWKQSICYLEERNVLYAIEIGPKDILNFMVKRITKNILPFTLNSINDLKKIKDKIGILQADCQ